MDKGGFCNFVGEQLRSLPHGGVSLLLWDSMFIPPKRPKHCYSLSALRKRQQCCIKKCHNRNVASMAGLGRLPLPAKCRVLEGISSLECPLFRRSYLPMNSGHSSLQIDWIGEVGRVSLWSLCVNVVVTGYWQQMAPYAAQSFCSFKIAAHQFLTGNQFSGRSGTSSVSLRGVSHHVRNNTQRCRRTFPCWRTLGT